MEKLTGVTQNYAWGSRTSIPEILGTEPTSDPVAEYWLGAHRSAPSVIADTTLDRHLEAHPAHIGDTSVDRFGPRLPYLLKLLAADQPLSLQAHPTRAQAEAGFARENEAGISLDARERTYRDDWPKPEAIVALTEFDALCGFRDPAETMRLFQGLGRIDGLDTIIGPLEERSGEAALQEVFLDILSLEPERMPLVEAVVASAVNHQTDDEPLGQFARTAVEIDAHYPGDPGILAALLLNRVTLQPGQAMFLEAGNMHAYLKGTGVEIMANSDNVLRGGLTPKHIDVDELVRCVEFKPIAAAPIPTETVAAGIIRYDTPAPEFALYRMDIDADPVDVPASGARIVLVPSGSAVLRGDNEELVLAQGEAAFLADGENVTVTGPAQVFVAAPGV